MTNIDKFIVHVVNNIFPLLEYSEGEMKRLMKHFKDEADDFDIEITDDRLEAYIKRFDQIKNGLNQKDIYKYSLPTLLKMLSKDTKVPEKVEREDDKIIPDVPDELYRSEDDKILLFYGMNLKDGEPGCVRLKNKEERWCITKRGNSMWTSYRRQAERGYPSFYLAYNLNLRQTDPLSAVALQARQNNMYAYTDRTNSPGMSEAMSFSELVNRIPWLSKIPDLQSKLKWIPLSKQEKQAIQDKAYIKLADWKNLPYQKKLNYFEDRAAEFRRMSTDTNYNKVFQDTSIAQFLQNVLPKYPEILKHFIDLSVNQQGSVFSPVTLLTAYEYFPEAQKKSLLRHIGFDKHRVPLKFLYQDIIPFELRQDITKDKAWEDDPNLHAFNVPNKDVIVLVRRDTYGENQALLTFFTPEETFENKPLNSKTAKYLVQDENISDIAFPVIANAITSDFIQGKDVKSVLGRYLNAPKTTVVSRKIDDSTIIFDESSLAAFELKGDKLTKLQNPQDFLDKVASTDEQKRSLQTNFFNGLKSSQEWKSESLPSTIDRGSFMALINSMPYEKRTVENGMILFAVPNAGQREPAVFLYNPNGSDPDCFPPYSWGRGSNSSWFERNSSNDKNRSFGQGGWEELFKYWRNQGTGITDRQLVSIMEDGEGYDRAAESKYVFAQLNPPMAAEANLKPVMVGDLLVLVNRANPANSYTVSRSRGKLTQKALTASKVRTILGEPAAQQAAEPQQGEQPQQQAVVQQAVQQGERVEMMPEFARLQLNYNALPRAVRIRMAAGAILLPTVNERGANTRNQLLGTRGRVTSIYKLNGTASAVYIITLTNGTQVASIAMQPGNYQIIVTRNGAYTMRSATELLNTLQNINEDMKKQDIKNLIREVVRQQLKEFGPATAEPDVDTEVEPDIDTTPDEDDEPFRIGNPNVQPEPKAQKTKEIANKIAQRFKAGK